jgi:signal transduction histidine kinase
VKYQLIGMTRNRTILSILLLAAVYFVSGRLGLSLAFVNESASAVWPPAGLALTALLLWGNRIWPGIFIGAFLVNVVTHVPAGISLPLVLLKTFGIAAGNTAEALVAAQAVRLFASGIKTFERAQDIFRFILFAALLSTAIGATIGATSLCASGFGQWHEYRAIWLTWWMGDMTSDLIVVPLLLVWVKEGSARLGFKRMSEAIVLLLAVSAVGYVVFHEKTPFDYVVIIPLLWAVFRFGELGAVTSTFITSAIALWSTLKNSGPFALDDQNKSLLLLQTFMGITSITALILAAVVSERKRVEQALREAKEQLATSNEQLEKHVQERTAELKETNSSLEAFVYSIAHDLRAPLRSMQAFSTMLIEDYAPKLDGTAQDYIRRIALSAESMDRLVLDLLAYSHVARAEIALTVVPVEAAWSSALVQNDHLIREKKALVKVTTPLPNVRAQLTTLNQVLANLLSNALKFVGDDVIPEIEFRAEVRANNIVRLSIKDNGIGIAAEHHDRVFHIFEQLNRKRYPGTGIGLSIVRKGVERMGGRVGLESEVGVGSQFWIELPKA